MQEKKREPCARSRSRYRPPTRTDRGFRIGAHTWNWNKNAEWDTNKEIGKGWRYCRGSSVFCFPNFRVGKWTGTICEWWWRTDPGLIIIAERTTLYENNSRFSSKFKGCSSLQFSCKLTVMCHATGYLPYHKTLCGITTIRKLMIEKYQHSYKSSLYLNNNFLKSPDYDL